MHMVSLGCTEGAFFEELWRSVLVFGVLKPWTYIAFIMAFRYRVCGHVPLSVGRVFTLAAVRAIIGFMIIGGSSQLLPELFEQQLGTLPHESPEVAMAIRGVLTLERLTVWLAIGWIGVNLRGRRLVGWTISGAAIDLAYDLLVERLLPSGYAPVWGIVGVVALFVGVLWVVGWRGSLVRGFAPGLRCGCGYDLAGNLSGRCPECGELVPEPGTVSGAVRP